ncbi:TRAP transporter large permease [Falsigemmobacter intermedius]|uniref:TRAP transporter large permease protein n=1 Tax=Falsigemmobacter intermedius TaxID=1553448 RepID=A0A444MAG9_9RHOB|nr:TRAP transporter large permease [Falsigemmobacter intermedius]RWY40434.1 TRAP transporter large permease [Falsigemmobacter intermedius]
MSDVSIGLSLLGLLICLLMLRMPIGITLISVSFSGLWILKGPKVAWGALAMIPYQFSASWVLSSIPMFLLLGYICFYMGLTQGLFRAARLWLSWLPGGLGISAIAGAAGFAAVSGSSIACSATIGRIAVPEMLKARYEPGFAGALVAAAGTIGALIPPSIILILYGIIAQQSIAKLFLGGLAAGLVTIFAYVTLIFLRAKFQPGVAPRIDVQVTRAEKLAALWETWPLILTVITIFGGIFFGVFTPTEAGAAGAFIALIIAIAKGEFTWKRLQTAAFETLLSTSMLLIIGIGASLLTRFLTISGAAKYLSGLVISAGVDPTLLMIGMVLIYLLLGMFLEPLGCMLLTLPILLPILHAQGFDMILFGIILCKLLEIGMLTPPVGMNVFVVKSVVGNSIRTGQIFRGVMWFIILDLCLVALFWTVPEIITTLPAMIR